MVQPWGCGGVGAGTWTGRKADGSTDRRTDTNRANHAASRKHATDHRPFTRA
jgi:hypothetical protein